MAIIDTIAIALPIRRILPTAVRGEPSGFSGDPIRRRRVGSPGSPGRGAEALRLLDEKIGEPVYLGS
jgi:hypothetical protein